MKLKAEPEAKKAYDRLKKAGQLAAGVIPPPRTKAEIKAAKAKAAEFVRWRRQEAAEKATVQPVYPTPERMRKEAHPVVSQTIGAGTAGKPLKQYRTKSPIAQYENHWHPIVLRAFRQFAKDAEAWNAQRVTVNYDAAGAGALCAPGSGGAPGRKIGGVGANEILREAEERFKYVKDRLNPDEWRVLYWLVLEIRHEATGKTMGWSEVGEILFTGIKDQRVTKGIAIGHLNSAGRSLARIYHLWHVVHRAEIGVRKDWRDDR